MTGAYPGGEVELFWLPPGGTQQGPLSLGRADGDGRLSTSWDTATAAFTGSYVTWVRDRASLRTSNRVTLQVDLSESLHWSCPSRALRGDRVREQASGVTPGASVQLFWTRPGDSASQGPLELGKADNSGNLYYVWTRPRPGLRGLTPRGCGTRPPAR